MKKKTTKRSYNRKTEKSVNGVAPGDSLVAFAVEENPPTFTGTRTVASRAAIAAVEKLLPNVKPGMAFLIPRKHRHVIKKYLATEHGTYKFPMSSVNGNNELIRVYKQEWPTSVPKKK